ncbi:MAG: ribonuclease HII [Candidatus Anstonellales archaeon]
MARAGLDEAGRGSVIGPLVVAIFWNEAILERLDVRDSKQMSPEEREEFFKKVLPSDYAVKKIMPEEIDKENINVLEAKAMAELIRKSRAEKIYADLPSVNRKGFRAMLPKDRDIVLSFKADEKYKIVSAASVIAKVIRDREIEEIRRKTVDFGSGYPSDKKTIAALQGNFEVLKPYVRKKWKTLERVMQKRLF